MAMFGLPAAVIFPFILVIVSHRYSDAADIKIHSKPAQSIPNNELSNREYGEEWKLRYFPDKSLASSNGHLMFADRNDMYNVPSMCDDGKTNTAIDWDGSPDDYTCTQKIFPPDPHIKPIIRDYVIPPAYRAPHYCMNKRINYTQVMTTFGGHRPLWAKYGEYKFIPRQRWLHNCEHGAVIMLYHPCADEKQVDLLRRLVTSCLRRHIISPYNSLPSDRPLALITWGWLLSLNVVDSKVVVQFIKDQGIRGPENEFADGKYEQDLIKSALVVSDEQDSVICPSVVRE